MLFNKLLYITYIQFCFIGSSIEERKAESNNSCAATNEQSFKKNSKQLVNTKKDDDKVSGINLCNILIIFNRYIPRDDCQSRFVG